MKLSKEELQELVDSRLVELETSITMFKDNESIVSDNGALELAKEITRKAEALEEAYNAKVDGVLEQLAEEAEEKWNRSSNVDVDKLSKGIELGWTSEEIQEYAKQFMKDNGYKLTETGKQVTTAISLLPEEG